MKRPLDVEIELDTDRYINGGSPSNTEKYVIELEQRIEKMENDLSTMKRLYKSGNWSSYGNVINS